MDKRQKRDLKEGAAGGTHGRRKKTREGLDGSKKDAGIQSVEISLDGPSPAEADALLAIEIKEVAQRKHRPAARALYDFLQTICGPLKTGKGDPKTNIIDQGAKVTYAVDINTYHGLMKCLEDCRLEGSAAHVSERQGSSLVLRTGVMVDFDMIIRSRTIAIRKHDYHRLANSFIARLRKDIDFASQLPPPKNKEHKFHMFFIVKPSPVLISKPAPTGEKKAAELPTSELPTGAYPDGRRDTYKYGIHVLIPGVKLARGYKKWMMRQLKTDPSIIATMRSLEAVGPDEDPSCLDTNCATVPVLFFGSCKQGGTPYNLGCAMEVIIDCLDATSPPFIRELADEELNDYNLASEMALIEDARYEDGRDSLVRKAEFDCRESLRETVRDFAERSAASTVGDEELLLTESGLSTLTVSSAEARLLHGLLDILPSEFYTDRNKRRDVIFALAGSSEMYKPLAEWFCQKFPLKWHNVASDNGRDAFEQIWNDGVGAAKAGRQGCLSKGSIIHWAQTHGGQRFSEVMDRSYFSSLLKYVYDYGGALEHDMVAQVLKIMLGAKFCVDTEASSRGRDSYIWFEFVVSGESMAPGEVWKWRREAEPDTLQKYISDELPKVLDRVSEQIEGRFRGARDEEEAKYYKNLAKTFSSTRRNMFKDTYKTGVIRQCQFRFRQRGFMSNLDKNGELFGVSNGVIHLGPKCKLINHFHEYPITKFTKVPWRRFDPERNPWDKIVLKMVEDIIPEHDARDRILFYVASSLDGRAKETIMLIWEGGGSNGKTSFLRAVANSLGGVYAKKVAITLLTSDREPANSPNSALMALKGVRLGYVEELNKSERANVARLKEIVNAGVVTGSEKFKAQEDFMIVANLIVASQYSFVIDTRDHGTWRRINHYTSKVKFMKTPDPENPFEKKDEPRFIREYPEDPNFLESMLALLVHYYERLQTEFAGQVKNVYSPTIEKETEAYRNSQDALNRFITSMVVVSPENQEEYPMAVVGARFTEWYGRHVDGSQRLVAAETIKDIESSAVAKYLKPAPNRTMVLHGCRILTSESMELYEGETLLSATSSRKEEKVAPTPSRCEKWWLSAKQREQLAVSEDLPVPPTSTRADNVGGDDDWLMLKAEELKDSPAGDQEGDLESYLVDEPSEEKKNASTDQTEEDTSDRSNGDNWIPIPERLSQRKPFPRGLFPRIPSTKTALARAPTKTFDVGDVYG